MRGLINYYKKEFCKHAFITEEKFVESEIKGNGIKVYMRCNKCGYHTKHWKFL